MNQLRTTEEILRELIRRKGIEYLRKEQLFVNAVADMGGAKRDIRLLRYLVEVDGVSSLLDAAGQPRSRCQTIYSQIVDRLCSQAVISRENAQEICGIFWRAVYNEEPPVTQQEETPAPQNVQESSAPPPSFAPAFLAEEKSNIRYPLLYEELKEETKPNHQNTRKEFPARSHAKSLMQAEKIHLFAPKRSKWERIALVLGWGFLLVEMLVGISGMGFFLTMLLEATSFAEWGISLAMIFLLVCLVLVPTAGLQICLLRDVEPYTIILVCSALKLLMCLVISLGTLGILIGEGIPVDLTSDVSGDKSFVQFSLYSVLYSVPYLAYQILGWKEVFTV